MSPRKDAAPTPDSRQGLSFAFPMRLPGNGTGAGGDKPADRKAPAAKPSQSK